VVPETKVGGPVAIFSNSLNRGFTCATGLAESSLVTSLAKLLRARGNGQPVSRQSVLQLVELYVYLPLPTFGAENDI
jgi:hypothetical protein